MNAIAVIGAAGALDLDGAATLASAGVPGAALWASVPVGGAEPSGLSWLFPGATRIDPRAMEARREVAAGLREPAGAPEDVVRLAVALGGSGAARIVADRRVTMSVAASLALLRERGAAGIDVVRGPVIVGPDGAPLWRADGPASIDDLAAEGYEADGIRRYLADLAPGDVAPWDRGRLDRANRDALLALPEARVIERVRDELESRGIALDGAALIDAWRALRPRLRRMSDVGAFLDFLRRDWSFPSIPVADRDQLRRLAGAVGERRPAGEPELGALLDELARDRNELHDLRRVLRWAITGQEIAPPVARVWALLGPDVALARALRANGGAGTGGR